MTVDSEAIFALMELQTKRRTRALRAPRHAWPRRWLDERDAGRRSSSPVAVARPLWIGRTRTALFFASTRRALAIVEAALGLRLETEQLREGRLVEARAGQIVRERRFRPDRRYREAAPLSPVHSPREAVSCL